jgi:hypothetical protein
MAGLKVSRNDDKTLPAFNEEAILMPSSKDLPEKAERLRHPGGGD